MRNFKKRYVPDLQLLSSLTEKNYARLRKLLPNIEEGVTASFELMSESSLKLNITITVEQVHKYTSMLVIKQVNSTHNLVNNPLMHVRMYHDANMAEVISFQGRAVTLGRFDYPNSSMHQPDEKTRLNNFLAEWLEHCSRFGCVKT